MRYTSLFSVFLSEFQTKLMMSAAKKMELCYIYLRITNLRNADLADVAMNASMIW